MELYAAAGVEFVLHLRSQGKRVFLDLKLYDIGETVKRATRQLCARTGATFLTVHGSRAVMRAAVEGRGASETRLLAVTVLTSFDQDDLIDLGYPSSASDLVELRVRKAKDAGIDGIVCSPLEVARVRQIAGTEMTLVTPGVRSRGSSSGDQKRIATPHDALRDGADYLVMGRQITRAADPRAACQEVLQEISSNSLQQ